jgi:mutator protein MutT
LMHEPQDNLAYRFPVSVKGVVVRDAQVVLLHNERDEWELPGGKLEPGESPAQCVVREIYEETGLDVTATALLDTWVYDITPQVRVLIVTYGCVERSQRNAVLSHEHRHLAWFPVHGLAALRMPEGYKQSVYGWAQRLQSSTA